MKYVFSGLAALSLAVMMAFVQCKETPNQATDKSMPKEAVAAKAVLAEVNCWTEGDNFHAVGLVDSEEPFWRKFWIEIGIVDAQGNIVKVGSDSFSIINTHADALPPRGRTAFMATWKLGNLKGTPDSIVLHGVRSIEVPPGAILIASAPGGGFKMSTIDTLTNESRELQWTVTGTIENPLPQSAMEPALSVLVYGKDRKLWYTQSFNTNTDTTIIKTSRYGPMSPNEKRQFGFNVFYESLPDPIRKTLIGRVDVLGHENRDQ
jgi:hypothetical protein